jgi:hypothetical protein
MSAKVPPKPSKDVIYLDVDDEITSIIDKVENADNKVVALVLPKRAASLQSIVNMKLLARSAKAAGKNPVLITSEAALLPLAGAAGLHVAKNLQSAPEVPEAPAGLSAVREADEPAEETAETTQAEDDETLPGKIDYASTVGALAAVHDAENPETIDLDDEDEADTPAPAAKTPKGPKNKVPNFDRFRLMLGLGIAGVIALIVFVIMAIFVLPKAMITLKTSSEPVSATFNLAAATTTPALDSQKNAIPAKLESSDQTGTQSVTATGSQNNGNKASGSVVFYNCSKDDTLSGTTRTVAAGTGVTSGGLSYTTTQAVDVAPSHFSGDNCKKDVPSSSVTVNAVQAGAKYNIDAASYLVYGSISASGSKMTGGSDNIITVLSQSDVDGAKEKLTSGTSGDQFSKDFENKLTAQDEYVLTSTMKAGDASITASPAVGQPASTANVTIKVTYTVLTVKKSDLSQAIEDKLAGQIDKTKQKLNGNFLNDANVTVQNQPSPNSAALSIDENTTAVPIINVASVKKQAEGKKTGDIKAALGGWAGVKEVDVKLSPFWVSKAPAKDSKIKVILQEVKTSSSDSGQP